MAMSSLSPRHQAVRNSAILLADACCHAVDVDNVSVWKGRAWQAGHQTEEHPVASRRTVLEL